MKGGVNTVKSKIEDEMHFLMMCPLFEKERNDLFSQIIGECQYFKNLDTKDKFFYMLNSEGDIIKWVARFCDLCFQIREKL